MRNINALTDLIDATSGEYQCCTEVACRKELMHGDDQEIHTDSDSLEEALATTYGYSTHYIHIFVIFPGLELATPEYVGRYDSRNNEVFPSERLLQEYNIEV